MQARAAVGLRFRSEKKHVLYKGRGSEQGWKKGGTEPQVLKEINIRQDLRGVIQGQGQGQDEGYFCKG